MVLGQIAFDFLSRQRGQRENHGARANCGQQFAGILSQQEDGGEVGGFFENFQERVCGLLHEGRVGEDVNALFALRRSVIDGLDDAANLVDLDHHLRGVGRDYEHIGMGLDEEAGFFLVGLAEVLASFDGLSEAGIEVGGLGDAGAVRAVTAEVGQAVGLGGSEAVQGLG